MWRHLLFFKLQIKLPCECLAAGHLSVLIAEGDAYLDESEVIAVGFDHLVLKLSSRVGRHIDSSWILRVLNKWSKSIKIG